MSKKDQRLDLKTLNEDLGSFSTQPDAQTILEHFNKLNDLELELDQDVVIEEIQQDQALIRALEQSKTVNGVVEVDFYLSSIKYQPTKYIDKDGKEQSTNVRNLNELDPTIEEITQIGFYEESDGAIQVARMPRNVERVTTKLPRQITSLGDNVFSVLLIQPRHF